MVLTFSLDVNMFWNVAMAPLVLLLVLCHLCYFPFLFALSGPEWFAVVVPFLVLLSNNLNSIEKYIFQL